MSAAKTSAICAATASGIPDSSVALNSVLWIEPLAIRVRASYGTVCNWASQRPSMRLRVRREKCVEARSDCSTGKRATSCCRAPPVSVSTCTILPPRPPSTRRAVRSLRRKAAASGSRTPRRTSRPSAESVARVTSLRESVSSCDARASICASSPVGCTCSETTRWGSSAGSGIIGATARAVMPKPAIKTAAPATMLTRRRLAYAVMPSQACASCGFKTRICQ